MMTSKKLFGAAVLTTLALSLGLGCGGGGGTPVTEASFCMQQGGGGVPGQPSAARPTRRRASPSA